MSWQLIPTLPSPLKSAVAKWFSDKTVGPDFNYHRVLEIGGTGGGSTPSLDLIPVDLDGDGSVDFLAFFPNTDVFTRWLEKSGRARERR